ncbi:MAG TPA: hypothetical protein VGJ25_09125 [Gaiellaceae bacterium]
MSELLERDRVSVDLLSPSREMRESSSTALLERMPSRRERRAAKRAILRAHGFDTRPTRLAPAAERLNLRDFARRGVQLDAEAILAKARPSGLIIRERSVPEHHLAWLCQQENRLRAGISDRELDAIQRGDAGLIVHEGRIRVIPRTGGGGPGSGAIYARNLPAPGSYVIDPVQFAAKTSKNRKTNPAITDPGVGRSFPFKADAVGILARMWLVFEGTYTSAATQATLTTGFPWQYARTITVSANGINNLIQADGLDLRALTRVRNKDYFVDRESAFTNPAATAAAFQRYIWELPLAYDESLIGAVFAQTEETFLNLQVAIAPAADLFSANAGTYSAGTWTVVTEYFSIPTVDAQNGRLLLLPDITQLHGLVSRDDAFSAAGNVVSPLTRTGGILLRVLQRIDNAAPNFGQMAFGGGATNGTITSHRFRYGGNVVPLDVPGYLQRFINELDYGDAIIPTLDVPAGTPAAYAIDDFVISSPLRDSIHMAGITEAQMINTVAAGTTVNTGAQVHTVQEAMVAG